jgi:hypothetical protein
LPAVVAGWERLRALNLATFYVVAAIAWAKTLVSKRVHSWTLPQQGGSRSTDPGGPHVLALRAGRRRRRPSRIARRQVGGADHRAQQGGDKSDEEKATDPLLSNRTPRA